MNPYETMSWFDPRNKEHLVAYRYLQRIGVWPEGFINDSRPLCHLWSIVVLNKLATAYLEDQLQGV